MAGTVSLGRIAQRITPASVAHVLPHDRLLKIVGTGDLEAITAEIDRHVHGGIPRAEAAAIAAKMREYVDFLGGQSPYDALEASDREALARLIEVEYFIAGATIVAAGIRR